MPQDKPNDEEISLTGAPPITKSSSQDAAKPDVAEQDLPKIGARVGSMAVAADLPDSKFLDHILGVDEKHILPWEPCRLPSRGLYYSSWNGVDGVDVRPFGQVADRILATKRLAQTGETVDYLLREFVRFPVANFDPMDLLIGDRTFLLYYLRGITHGNMYEFAISCVNPECGQASTHQFDLNNLVATLRYADESLGPEPFKVELPYLTKSCGRSVWVEVRLLRGRDAYDMMNMRKTRQQLFPEAVKAGRPKSSAARRRAKETIDDSVTENMQVIITSVMGDRNEGKIKAFVERMHATDTATIREFLRENTPGIDPIVTIKCPECGFDAAMELPTTESFFRPAAKRRDG